MSRPEQSILGELELKRARLPQLFQGITDGDLLDRMAIDYTEKMGAPTFFYNRSTYRDPQGPTQSAGVDDLFGDVQDPEFLQEKGQHQLRSVVEHKPSDQRLLHFGVDEQREVIFWYPAGMLRRAELITEIRFRGIEIGDLIVWDGSWYIVAEAHRDHYLGNSGRFIWSGAFCNRYHHGALPVNMQAQC